MFAEWFYTLRNYEKEAKIIWLTFIFIILSLINIQAQKACPVNFNSDSLEIVKNNIDKWNGEIVACEVIIMQIEKGYKDKPYYKVKIEGGGQIWIGSLVNSGFEKVGAQLRILGNFSKIDNDDKALKYNKDGYHILAFVVIDLLTKKASMLPGSEKQLNEWVNGSVPKSRK